MVGRGELTAGAWTTIEPLLPRGGARGGQWRDHRRIINGILWTLATGAPWRESQGNQAAADFAAGL